MINITISKKRWDALRNAMTELGKGRMDQQLLIGKRNDKFEALEVHFNMVSEELSRRLLHLSFVKPAEFQRYTNHFVIITDKKFHIKNVSQNFLGAYQLEPVQIEGRSFLTLTDPETVKILERTYTGLSAEDAPHDKKMLELYNDQFLYSIEKMYGEDQLVINLYQLYMDKRYFKPAYETAPSIKKRMRERKRYEEVIEKVKTEIDVSSFSEKARLEDIVKRHSININLLKKMFKEQYQCGVYQYQIKLRMQAAHDLVVAGETPFKQIAFDVGYKNYEEFVKYFKKYYNILPSQLRRLSSEQPDRIRT